MSEPARICVQRATGGGFEVAAFGGTGSDVAIKREYCDFKWSRELWGRGAGGHWKEKVIISSRRKRLRWLGLRQRQPHVCFGWCSSRLWVGFVTSWKTCVACTASGGRLNVSVCNGSWMPLKNKKFRSSSGKDWDVRACFASGGNLTLASAAIRGSHTVLFVPLTSIPMHADASHQKRRLTFQCIPKLKLGELWPAYSHDVIPCDRRQIHKSRHDLLSESTNTFKTAALQGSWGDCMFLTF